MPRRSNPKRRPLGRPGRPRRRANVIGNAWLEFVVGGQRPANDNADGDSADAGQTTDLAQAIAAARRRGIRWKDLVQRYGLSRTRLWQLCREAEARQVGATGT